MNPSSYGRRPSEIASIVGDVIKMYNVRIDMPFDEIENQRLKQREEVAKEFTHPRDQSRAEELLDQIDREFEENLLKALLGSLDPNKIWSIVNHDDVLSGFIPAGPPIGHGGTSSVHHCFTRYNYRTVVVKLIKYADAKQRVDKMLAIRELQTLLKCDHPNIVKVFDAGYVKVIENGHDHVYPYLAMERLRGCTLRQWVKKNHPNAKPENRKDWLQVVARAGAVLANTIEYCHHEEITHGDVKPDNIHVTGAIPTDSTLKLYDFGFSADEHGLIAGRTLGYCHPNDRELSDDARRSRDLFALGITLLYFILGEEPISKPAAMHAEQFDIELRSAIARSESRDLQLILAKATARDPAVRYPSAQMLYEDLAAFHEDRPIPHARKKGYSWWGVERLLLTRCWKRGAAEDQWTLIGQASVIVSILFLCGAVIHALRTPTTSNVVTLFNEVADAVFGIGALIGMVSLAVCGIRRESITINLPFVTIIVATYILAFGLLPALETEADLLVDLKYNWLLIGTGSAIVALNTYARSPWFVIGSVLLMFGSIAVPSLATSLTIRPFIPSFHFVVVSALVLCSAITAFDSARHHKTQPNEESANVLVSIWLRIKKWSSCLLRCVLFTSTYQTVCDQQSKTKEMNK